MPRGFPGIDGDASCFFAFFLYTTIEAAARMMGRHIALKKSLSLSSIVIYCVDYLRYPIFRRLLVMSGAGAVSMSMQKILLFYVVESRCIILFRYLSQIEIQITALLG